MRRSPWLLALVVVSAWLASASLVLAAPKVDPKAEAKAKEKIVEAALAGAGELLGVEAYVEAARALAVAKEAGAAEEQLAPLRAKVRTDATPNEEGKERWKKLAGELAKAYEKLAALPHEPADDARFEGYLFKSAELDPGKARFAKLLASVKQASGNKGQAHVAGRQLVRLRELDADGAAEGRYDALELELATSDVAMIKSPTHPMVGWLSLPAGWTKKGPWPVLVAVEGAGSNFLGAARGFRGARGARKALVLAPCTLSNTNELKPETYPFYDPALLKEWNGRRVEFDIAGLEALLEVLRTRYGAEEKVAITGFSGGGNLCYGLTLRHPERVWCAAPACANFNPGLPGNAKPVEGGGPLVHILTGEKDEHRDHVFGQKPGIEGQSDWAQEAFAKLQFTRVKRTMLPGVGHSACANEVWDFFDACLAAR
jgi:predicted esterase